MEQPIGNKLPNGEGYLEKCFNCQQVFFLAELAEHMEQCSNKTASSTTTNSATAEDESNKTSSKVDDSYFIQKYGQGMVSELQCSKCGCEVQLHSAGTYTSDSGSIKIYADDEEFVCSNSECSKSDSGSNIMLKLTSSPFDVEDSNKAPEASWDGPADICNLVKQTVEYCQKQEITNPVEVLRYYQSVMVTGRPLNVVDNSQDSEGPTNYILVDRYNLVQTAFDEIKTMDNLRQTLEVQFYGEEAEDIGGPRREFFRLIV